MPSKQAERMARARTRCVAKAQWYGGQSLRLDMHESDSVPTAATDGVNMPYNPTYTATLTDGQCVTLVAHETLHPALGHLWRMQGKDAKLANIAADYVTNNVLTEDGFEPIPDWLFDARFKGMSFEEVYGIVGREEREEPGRHTGKPNGLGNDMQEPASDGDSDDNSPPTNSQPSDKPSDLELDWQMSGEEAKLVADKRGEMSGAVARAITERRKPKADPWAVLRRFVERHGEPTNYTWARPNKRMYVAHDLYLPGIDNPNMAPIILAIDTSGSVTAELLNEFAAHARHIVQELKPQALHVIYCDSRISNTQTFLPGDTIKFDPGKAGGGTAFQPVFDHIATNETYQDAACIVYLTDADGDNATLKDTANKPTLWGITPGWARPLPFGETVKLY